MIARMGWAPLIVLGVLIVIQLIPVARTNPDDPPGMELSAPVTPIFQRSCYDCHSNRTVWPWYAHVAPVSWLVVHDVDEGRQHLNFSRWSQYTAAQQRHLAAEIREQVEEGEMPMSTYVWMHPEARLTAEDRHRLEGWSRSMAGDGEPESEHPH